MRKTKTMLFIFLMAASFASHAQEKKDNSLPKVKLIAVVTRASWCGVCKEHGARAGAVLMPYTSMGLTLMMNDISDKTTKEASKQTLQKEKAYDAVAGITQTGTIAFISTTSHKLIEQISISLPDKEIKSTIDNLLKQAK